VKPDPAPPPERLALTAGPLPAPGTLPRPYPFESIAPTREGFVERDGIRSWYAQFGATGPWLVFAPVFQIGNAYLLRGVVPWLAQHFRVVVGDLRGNGRSDRPTSPEQYSFDHYHADFVAILDRLEVDRAALVGISAAAMTVLRVAAEQPERVSHLVIVGGLASRLLTTAEAVADGKNVLQRMRADWPAYLDEFFGICFSEPHSTKPYEDGVVRCGAAGGPIAPGWGVGGRPVFRRRAGRSTQGRADRTDLGPVLFLVVGGGLDRGCRQTARSGRLWPVVVGRAR